jgi:hypothetical protein
MNDRGFNSKQMGDACEMLVAAELTLQGVPALKVTDFWPDYDVIAQPRDGEPQRISVKSATPGKNYSRVVFDPKTCNWLAIVLFEKERRRIFLLPSDVAADYSSKAHKRATCHLYFAELRKEPLSRYENNFN